MHDTIAFEATDALPLAHERCAPRSNFARYGYQIFRGRAEAFNGLRTRFERYLSNALAELDIAREDLVLERYHRLFEHQPGKHHEFLGQIRRVVPRTCFDGSHEFLRDICEQASEFFGARASIYEGKIEFRVVRPNCADNNALHRDHWFPYFTPLVNIYVPLAGSHCDSAMKVVPKSHRWTDEEVVPTFPFQGGKTINKDGIAFSTPCIKTCVHPLIEHRPDVAEGDFMLFSPLSVHGGGDNHSDETRFSLEIRLQLDGGV